MRQLLRLLVFLTVAAAIIIPGCYTILKHPNDESGYSATQVSDCTRCHGDYQEYPYGYYYSPYPDFWWEYEKYGYFYAYPWWWDFYDYPYINGEYAESSRGSKYDKREAHPAPAAPPHAFGGGYMSTNGSGIYYPGGTSGGQMIIDGTGSTTSRPATGTETRSKDGEGPTEGKVEPPTKERTTPQPEPNKKSDDTKKAEDKKKETTKKKSKRGKP
ncbi:MAG: hypothetical protein ABIE07_07270 [Candidatus Zixiibacteriota bacterium]